MMNKKILLPFAFSTLAILLHGCGGESSKINEDPTKGVTGVTSNTSCNVTADDCLQFVLDYPIAGLNFDCSSDKVNHFATKLDGNIVTGACKLGDSVTFYIQGAQSPRKISLGTIQLDNISKIKLALYPRIRVIDFAAALTGKQASLNINDETIRVAMALVKIFQSVGLEQDHNVVGDIQPTAISDEKKQKLSAISKDVGVAELASGEYVDILKPWLDVSPVSNEQAFTMVTQLLNLSNAGIWQADLPIYKAGSDGTVTQTLSGSGVRPDGFFGCNKAVYLDCMKASSSLLHSMGRFFLLSDRQGYTLGSGQQWRGSASLIGNYVTLPYILTTKVKPIKMQINAQNAWFNSISQDINSNQPLRLSLTANAVDDVLINQGKLMNGNTIAGTEAVYKQLVKAKDTDTVDSSRLGVWQQTIDGNAYKGTIDIFRVNPASYLDKNIFQTEANVKAGKPYLFPLYATLTFKFNKDTTFPAVDIGIMIDEHGDIRTDIKKDSTSTDMSGNCARTQTKNADGTITDEFGETQYRIGTTGATLFSTNDKSITVRMILSNPKFGMLDGNMFGLNLTETTGAKINIHNLLNGQATGINLTDFSNSTVPWANFYAAAQASYIKVYDELADDTARNAYVKPTDEERALAKRASGTVSIKIADQKIPACNAIKIKS
ncbi:hypothetical protein NDN11_03405 [Acinetobacter sp. C26M]|uniref:putative pilus system protein FilF n=1 Tax=unclassified Acinetobacter TaxID=196816 RepID=UPI0020372016|nr:MULTISPECIES: hypothetical protein [unclassified Acinetobacter]USA47186.1 hypothetical protein NDN11_03405 [Acinetobacter sp. C26M]USA50667.1 hypothetical protein NDN12_03405 [Acinetobacter sp. C26G]